MVVPEAVDLSQVKLTHHKLSSKGTRHIMPVGGPKLQPVTVTGKGRVHVEDKVLLLEIIEKLNELFVGDISDDDKVSYVLGTLRTKLFGSEVLPRQVEDKAKERFAALPQLFEELTEAIMGSYAAHSAMSKQALESNQTRSRLLDLLLNEGKLYFDRL